MRNLWKSRHWGAEPDDPTVREFLTAWVVGKQSLRPSTRLSYGIHVRRYLVPYLGDLPLRGLRALHIERMYHHLATADEPSVRMSTATLRRIHCTLMSALNTAASVLAS